MVDYSLARLKRNHTTWVSDENGKVGKDVRGAGERSLARVRVAWCIVHAWCLFLRRRGSRTIPSTNVKSFFGWRSLFFFFFLGVVYVVCHAVPVPVRVRSLRWIGMGGTWSST